MNLLKSPSPMRELRPINRNMDFYITAHKEGKRPLFVSVHHHHHMAITDELIDRGYTLGHCAEWYYWANADKKHSQREKDALCLCFDDGDGNRIDDIFNHHKI